jgi:hypothetical protein
MVLPVPVPRTFTVGETETAAYFNAVRDALNFLLNPPVFKGIQATTQAIASGAWTSIALDSSSVDSYTGHSNVTNNSRYTAQVAGWYWAEGYVAWQATGATCRFDSSIFRNGAAVPGSSQFLVKPGTDLAAISASTLTYLAVGDYVEMNGRQSSGGSINTDIGTDLLSCLNVFWLHV